MKTVADSPINPIVSSRDVANIGLTKREYFAALAMQGLLANPEWMKVYKSDKYLMQSSIVAEVSCKQADALITELNKHPQ